MKIQKKQILALIISSALVFSHSQAIAKSDPVQVTVQSVAENYATIAAAMINDSLTTGQALQTAIEQFLNNPSDENLDKAKAEYALARAPYQQSEVLRFDAENGHVTEGLDKDGGPASMDDWEGQLNAWPLDEALIDYVDASAYEGEYSDDKNIINGLTELNIGSENFDISNINAELLIALNEVGGSEANVATGIHAIEFLLWGQDLNGTNAGAGNRPITDYNVKTGTICTSGPLVNTDSTICERRAQYLRAVTQLYVDDLALMTNEWSEKARTTEGTLAYDYLNNGRSIARIVDSVGDMAAGELASERMKVAVLFGSTEDEHDCFSDNTHIAIYNNAKGLMNAYRGSYTNINGETLSGPSLSDLVKSKDANLDASLNAKLDIIDEKMQKIVDLAEHATAPIKFDQIVGGTEAQKALVLDASDALLVFADELGENIGTILAIDAQEFDKGTCPSGDVNDCDAG